MVLGSIVPWLTVLVASVPVSAPAANADGGMPSAPSPIDPLVAATDPHPRPVWQMRIEQRIIIRVPHRSNAGNAAASVAPPMPPRPRSFRQRKIGKCLPMRSIGAVQVLDDDSLVFYLRDRRLVRAALERSCRARDFYQGFYMEQSEDGLVCIARDVLQARSGSRCAIDEVRELVPADPDDE